MNTPGKLLTPFMQCAACAQFLILEPVARGRVAVYDSANMKLVKVRSGTCLIKQGATLC